MFISQGEFVLPQRQIYNCGNYSLARLHIIYICIYIYIYIYLYIHIYDSVRLDWPPDVPPQKKKQSRGLPGPALDRPENQWFFLPRLESTGAPKPRVFATHGTLVAISKNPKDIDNPQIEYFFTFWDQTWDIRYFGTNMGPSKTLFFCVPPPGRRIICCKNVYITRIPFCVPPRQKKPMIYL